MYFNQTGRANTPAVLAEAVRVAKERGISHIVVASNTGETARLLYDTVKKAGVAASVVCVTHVYGFAENGQNEMKAETRSELETLGLKVYTTTHVLSGAERHLSKKFGGVSPVEMIAHSLRMFGQGVKVCVEVAVMALDGGLIPYGRPVIAVGGSNGGADASLLLTPAHAGAILDTRIHEVLCKPL